MPYARITERLGLQAGALANVATAAASVAVASTRVATSVGSDIIDTWTTANQRYLVRAALYPLTTAATGAATVAIYHGTATGAMSAASVGTGTTPMQATASVDAGGKIVTVELEGADLVGKNRYLQAIVIPGGSLAAAAAVTIDGEPSYLEPAPPTSLVAEAVTPVIVADL